MKYPLATFAPDLNPQTPGIAVSVSNAFPSETGGLRATPTPAVLSQPLADTVKSSFSFQDSGLNYRHLAATATKIYELGGTTWTDVSNVSTSYFNVERWRYSAWGNWVLAVDINTATQKQTLSLNPFEDLDGSPPQAKYICTVKNFVVLACQPANLGQRLQWCAEGDATDWTPSLTTQAGYTDLIDTSGPITGLSRLGDGFVAFKERAMYLGYYSGAPFVWSIQRIPALSGCVANDAILELEGALYYPGIDDFYVFDGTFPRRIGAGVREWFFAHVNRTFLTEMRVSYDFLRRLIFWWYPTSDDTIQECLIYDVASNRWGRMVQPVQEVMNLYRAGVTYGTIPDWFPQYIDIENSGLTYGSPFWTASMFNMAVYTTSNELAIMTGTPGTANLITGDIGDLIRYSRIRRAWPYFDVEPTTCSAKARGKTKLGGTVTEGGSNNLKTDGGIDLDLTAKFLSLDLTMTGDWDMVGYDADLRPVAVN